MSKIKNYKREYSKPNGLSKIHLESSICINTHEHDYIHI